MAKGYSWERKCKFTDKERGFGYVVLEQKLNGKTTEALIVEKWKLNKDGYYYLRSEVFGERADKQYTILKHSNFERIDLTKD